MTGTTSVECCFIDLIEVNVVSFKNPRIWTGGNSRANATVFDEVLARVLHLSWSSCSIALPVWFCIWSPAVSTWCSPCLEVIVGFVCLLNPYFKGRLDTWSTWKCNVSYWELAEKFWRLLRTYSLYAWRECQSQCQTSQWPLCPFTTTFHFPSQFLTSSTLSVCTAEQCELRAVREWRWGKHCPLCGSANKDSGDVMRREEGGGGDGGMKGWRMGCTGLSDCDAPLPLPQLLVTWPGLSLPPPKSDIGPPQMVH